LAETFKKVASGHQEAVLLPIKGDAKENEKVGGIGVKIFDKPSPSNARYLAVEGQVFGSMGVLHLKRFAREQRRTRDIKALSGRGRNRPLYPVCYLDLKTLEVGLFPNDVPATRAHQGRRLKLTVHVAPLDKYLAEVNYSFKGAT
jgi:hypothetical protein